MTKAHPLRWLQGLWRRHVVDLILEQNRMIAPHKDRPDWKLVSVLVVSAISLTLIEYFGKNRYYWDFVHPRELVESTLEMLKISFARYPEGAPPNWYHFGPFISPLKDPNTPDAQLWQLIYWSGWCVLTYFLIPAAFVVFVLKEKLSDYGLKIKGSMRHLWLYFLLFAIVAPFVFLVSGDASFQETYPFYRSAVQNPTGFWIWELAYAAQFFSLEFFFRGFMLHGTKHRLGAYSVLVMVIPYCMIHFGKPLPETLGAILAGLVLGLLSLRTGAIFLGFLIHVSVALTMDFAALWRRGELEAIFKGLF